MKLIVALVGGFQPLTILTKNSKSRVAGVLDSSLEHYIVF